MAYQRPRLTREISNADVYNQDDDYYFNKILLDEIIKIEGFVDYFRPWIVEIKPSSGIYFIEKVDDNIIEKLSLHYPKYKPFTDDILENRFHFKFNDTIIDLKIINDNNIIRFVVKDDNPNQLSRKQQYLIYQIERFLYINNITFDYIYRKVYLSKPDIQQKLTNMIKRFNYEMAIKSYDDLNQQNQHLYNDDIIRHRLYQIDNLKSLIERQTEKEDRYYREERDRDDSYREDRYGDRGDRYGDRYGDRERRRERDRSVDRRMRDKYMKYKIKYMNLKNKLNNLTN